MMYVIAGILMIAAGTGIFYYLGKWPTFHEENA